MSCRGVARGTQGRGKEGGRTGERRKTKDGRDMGESYAAKVDRTGEQETGVEGAAELIRKRRTRHEGESNGVGKRKGCGKAMERKGKGNGGGRACEGRGQTWEWRVVPNMEAGGSHRQTVQRVPEEEENETGEEGRERKREGKEKKGRKMEATLGTHKEDTQRAWVVTEEEIVARKADEYKTEEAAAMDPEEARDVQREKAREAAEVEESQGRKHEAQAAEKEAESEISHSTVVWRTMV